MVGGGGGGGGGARWDFEERSYSVWSLLLGTPLVFALHFLNQMEYFSRIYLNRILKRGLVVNEFLEANKCIELIFPLVTRK